MKPKGPLSVGTSGQSARLLLSGLSGIIRQVARCALTSDPAPPGPRRFVPRETIVGMLLIFISLARVDLAVPVPVHFPSSSLPPLIQHP
ncbi:MAG: hypothetical protein JO151_15795 [Verrucomicrobia bacterium]|nr:hypothetical protein [Verrucomicrobiota bacterium]